MAFVAGLFLIGKQRDGASISPELEVAPDQFPGERRGEDCFRIVAISGRDRLHLIALGAGPVTRVFHSSETAIPNDNAAARMPRRDQAIDDGVDHIAMGGEKLAARRGNLDANLVVRRNE